MSAPRIAVVGSYATGLTMKMTRLPSSGETVLASGYRVDHGGKGSNQAVACARLGAKVSFVARIGQDGFGESALKMYREEQINVDSVRQTREHPTGVGFILVERESGHNCIAFDPGANELLTASDVRQSEGAFSEAKVVLAQLEIPVEAAEAAMACGRKSGAITILNPAPVRALPPAVLELVDILTPNQTEAKVLTGRNPRLEVGAEEVARDLIRLGVKQVVMTLGEQGALIVDSAISKRIPAIPVSVVDTTGAGDAFNAGIATALAFGAALEEAVEFGVIVGAMAVTRDGVIPALPRRGEVVEFCAVHNLRAASWLSASSGRVVRESGL